MTDLALTIKRAKKFYQSGKESDRNNLIDIYDTLTTDEHDVADEQIGKFLPSWSA